MKLSQILNVKKFQIYILSEKPWISSEKHDDLIYNEHEVVAIFADKILIINTKNETTTNELYFSCNDSINILLFYIQNFKNFRFTPSKSNHTNNFNNSIHYDTPHNNVLWEK